MIHIRIRTINTLKPCNMHTALERDSRMWLGKVMVGKAWRCEQRECCKSEHSRVCSDTTHRKKEKKGKKHDESLYWSILYQRDPSHIYSPGPNVLCSDYWNHIKNPCDPCDHDWWPTQISIHHCSKTMVLNFGGGVWLWYSTCLTYPS